MILYTAGWNMPGCLPEADPVSFGNGQEARAYLCAEVERAGDEYAQGGGDPDPFYVKVSRWEEQDAEGVEDQSDTMPDGYAYWISVEDVEDAEARAILHAQEH